MTVAEEPGAGRLPTAAEVGGKAAALLELERAGFRIPKTFCSPPDLAAAVAAIGGPIAVRSSATVEDGAQSSFAGQFESYLHLEGLEAVADAVERCKAAVAAPSVREYCRTQGIDPDVVRMEVIVQEMVLPELAGVAFTVNPVTGAEEVVIEAVEGVADELLAGKRPPLPADHPLLARHRAAIEDVCRRIQRHYGAPQDVEFAVREGEVYVLQARPITKIGFSPEVGEWTTADLRDGGVSSEACTPLMESLYDLAFQRALPGYLRELKLLRGDFDAMRSFFGRPYWNFGAVKECLAQLPGFVEREFDADLSIEGDYEGDGVVTPVTLGGVLRAVPTVLALRRLYRRQEAFDRAFLEGGFEALERRWEELPPGDLTEPFRRLVREDFLTTEENYFRTIFCASMAKLELLEGAPDVDTTALVAGLPPMSHLEPSRALREMAARGETDVAPLLRRFRHHSRRELDLRCPRWDEDRAFVEELLAQYRGAPAPDEGAPRRTYEAARREALARLPWWKRRGFLRRLERLRRFVWLREEMRDRSSRMYYLIRRWVLELARREGLGDDVFFMTWEEVVARDRRRVDERRERFESYRNFKAPNEIGSRFRWDGGPATGDLTGIGASQGVAEGPARVARTVEEAARVEAGAVLVCPFTDPGWTPTLERVAAVVTETGGLLSHAAVICREYGKPAVLNVPGATERIPDGQRVRVDGGAGRVHLVE